jgi:hypothetical protein
MKSISSNHNSIMLSHPKMEQMKCTRCQHLLKEIQDQEELVPHLVKIKIREEIEEAIDNKISNLAVEQMEEKE